MRVFKSETILISVLVAYAVKLIGVVGIGGASMACVDGGNCSPSMAQLFDELRFAAAYAVGGIIYLITMARRMPKYPIDYALSTVLFGHVGWLVFIYLLYAGLVAPLVPELLSYYDSPGARAVRFADSSVVPIVLTGVLILSWSRFVRENK
jgi:hypothetical protein